MNKRTVALTVEQYKNIIQTMKEGCSGCRPNHRIATALMLEGNLGLRISDILRLRLCDIIKDGERYRLSIIEQKTGKARVFTVPIALYQFIRLYCMDSHIPEDAIIFPLTERQVQKHLQIVCAYLGYEGISTHSFRKFYATEIDGSLESMQGIVGGLIQVIYPFDDPVAIVCNDEGKLMGLPLNRPLTDCNGDIYDIIAGTFFLCSAPTDSDSFGSLTEEQISKYTDYYKGQMVVGL